MLKYKPAKSCILHPAAGGLLTWMVFVSRMRNQFILHGLDILVIVTYFVYLTYPVVIWLIFYTFLAALLTNVQTIYFSSENGVSISCNLTMSD